MNMKFGRDQKTSSIELTADGRREIIVRQTFKHAHQFVLTMITALIGLHNFARFPYLTYYYGHGSFVIAYFCLLFLIARPLLAMEMCLGQFSSKGNIKIFRALGHLYGGIGLSQTINVLFSLSFTGAYESILIFYFSQSFHYVLPWTYCHNEWNVKCQNSTDYVNVSDYTTNAKLYFSLSVINENMEFSKGLDFPNWHLVIALFCSWFLAFLVLIFGVQSVAKVNQFLGVFPLLMLVVIAVETFALSGGKQGVTILLNPKWKELFSLEVWHQALVHTLSSVSIGIGTNSMYASYNVIDTNLISVSWLLCVADFLGSVMAATTFYAAMGHLSFVMRKDMSWVMIGGQELWVLYSDIVINLGTPYVMSTVFFFLFVALGLGTLVSYQQLITTQYTDYDPTFFKDWHLSALTAGVGFAAGLVFITPQGRILGRFMETVTTCVSTEIISWITAASISYGYGLRKFCWDVEYMTSQYPGMSSRLVWRIGPFIIPVSSLLNSHTHRKLKYVLRQFSSNTHVIGWVLIGLIAIPIILVPIVEIMFYRKVGFRKKLELLTSDENWEPNQEKIRYKRYIYLKEEEFLNNDVPRSRFKAYWDIFIAKK